MIAELYISGQDHPAIFDAVLTLDGILDHHGQGLPIPGIMQVILEDSADCPTAEQLKIIRLLHTMGEFHEAYLFREKLSPTGFERYKITTLP